MSGISEQLLDAVQSGLGDALPADLGHWMQPAADALRAAGGPWGSLPELVRMLSAEALHGVLRSWDDFIVEAEQPAALHDQIRRHLIAALLTRGGKLLPEPASEIRRRRRRIARKLRGVVDAIMHDEFLRVRWASHLATLAEQLEHDQRIAGPKGSGPAFRTADYHDHMGGPFPQPGRANAQQTLLERTLCRQMIALTRAPQTHLVAVAVEVAFDLPERLDPHDLNARWHSFSGRN